MIKQIGGISFYMLVIICYYSGSSWLGPVDGTHGIGEDQTRIAAPIIDHCLVDITLC